MHIDAQRNMFDSIYKQTCVNLVTYQFQHNESEPNFSISFLKIVYCDRNGSVLRGKSDGYKQTNFEQWLVAFINGGPSVFFLF